MQVYRQEQFTGVATGMTVDCGGWAVSKYAIQVKSDGSVATAWNVVVEGSLDGTNFMTIIAHTTAQSDGAIVFSATESPVLYVRSRVTSITLGLATDINVTFIAI